MTNARISKAICAVVALGSMMMSALPAMAADRLTPAKIPFNFEVRGEKLPAGRYLLDVDSNSGLVTLTDAEGVKHAYISSASGNPNRQCDPKLVFEYDGGAYRLSEMYLYGTTGGRAMPKPKKQADFSASSKKVQRIEVALNR